MPSPARISPSLRAASWLATVSWCALIFVLSSRPHLRIVHDDLLDLVLRKGAHMCVYAILTLLASMTLRQEGMSASRSLVGGLGWSILYAASDEYHQTFVDGRHGSPVDVLIDTLGAGLAALLVWRRLRSARPR